MPLLTATVEGPVTVRRVVQAVAAGTVLAVPALVRVLPASAFDPASVSTITIATQTTCASQTTGPFKLAISPDSNKAYVTLNGDGRVARLSTATDSLDDAACTGARYPESVAVSPDGSRIYVTNSASNILRVIDTSNMSTVTDLNVGSAGNGMEVVTTPASVGKVYVYRHVENSLVVIRVSDNTVLSTVSVGGAGIRRSVGIVASPDGSALYLVDNDAIAIVSTATDTVTGSIPLTGAAGVAVSPDGSYLYVIGGASDDALYRVRLSDNSVIDSSTVGAGPRGIAFTPSGSFALVTLNPSNTVAIVDTTTNEVIDTVSVGSNPYGIAVSPDGTFAYVANWGGGYGDTVSRLNLGGLSLPPTGADHTWMVWVGSVMLGLGLAVIALARIRKASPTA